MKEYLTRIEQLTSELNELKPLKANDQSRLDKKFRLEFNYNSNHLEGNTLTYGETKLLLFFDDPKGNHTLREFEEMKSHDVALSMIQDLARESKERPLTEQNIKNLNEIILVRPFWKDAITSGGQSTRRQIKVGDYKEFPNSVRLSNGELFEYATPQETPILMAELMDWYREELKKGELPPITLAALFHYRFVRIHPFDDGNGRLSRLLMNYVLYCFDLPPVIIKSADKANYLKALHEADAGNLDAFVLYIVKQLEWSLELTIKAAKGEPIEEEDDLDKQIELFKKQVLAKPASNETATNDSIIKALQNEVIPLFVLLESKLKRFNGLFYNTLSYVEINKYDNVHVQLMNLDKIEIAEALNDLLEQDSLEKIQKIKSLEYHHTFKGFKKLTDPGVDSLFLNVEFRKYDFVIWYSYSKNKTIVNYGNAVNKQLIANEIAQSFLKQLESV